MAPANKTGVHSEMDWEPVMLSAQAKWLVDGSILQCSGQDAHRNRRG